MLQHATRRQPSSAALAALLERDVQAVGQEGDEDVCLDAAFGLVMNGTDRQITLQVAERLLDFGKLNIVLP